MASSRIEIASSRYGCVLRDHNQRIIDRERNREGTTQAAALRKNLEEFVRDHFHTCIVLSAAPIDSDTASSDENSQPRFNSNRDCWVRNNNNNNNMMNNNSHNFRSVERESNNYNNNQEETEAAPNESPTTSMMRRQSRILDRWAARQAEEMINTMERQPNEAELLALSSTQPVSARASTFLRENSPAASDSSSVDLPNLRASSLVQMWREIEAESTTPRGNQSGRGNLNFNPPVSRCSSSGSSRGSNNSTISNVEDSSYVEDPSVRSEVCESSGRIYEAVAVPEDSVRSQVCDSNSIDERYETIAVPEDSFTDWESDRTAPSEPRSSFQRQSSDGESERGRVADLIRRLTSASQPQSPVASSSDELDREHSVESFCRDQSISDHGEQRDLSAIGNTLRVRGRQAIKDLLIQMEQERQKELSGLVERHAVSRFSQRGRLQALLRLKFLQRGAGAQDQQRPASAASELDQLQRRPTILLLRERFSSSVERNGMVVTIREDNSRSPRQLNNSQDSEQSTMVSQDSNHQEDVATTTLEQKGPQEHNSIQSTSERLQEAVSQSSDVPWEGPSSAGVGQLNWQGPVNTAESSHGSEGDVITEEPQDLETRQHRGSIDGWEGPSSGIGHLDWQRPVDTAESSNVSEGDVIREEPELENQQHVGSRDGWQGVIVTEEPDPNTHEIVESVNGSWLPNISRPRSDFEGHQQSHFEGHRLSDFEGRRQAWYRNMLESNSDNDEIRALFERRSVSTFLTSGLRARMDQMVCSFLSRQSHRTTSSFEEEEDEEEGEGEGEEEESPINHQYNEVSDDSDQVASTSLQLPLPSRLRSRSHYQDNDVNDGYDQFATTSLQLPQSSRSYEEDSQQSSPFTRHPSLEMELIYDLRGHMAQLSQEMCELRKSIKSCMGMQVKLQSSIKKEASASVYHSNLLFFFTAFGDLITQNLYFCETQVGEENQWSSSIIGKRGEEALAASAVKCKSTRFCTDVDTCAPVSTVPMSCSGVAGDVRYVELQF
ncbi:hypothetical protein BVC80_3g14 [Macleaya cordata]|uniref:Uncharacterized protein n=1 Tax=Macleaya cordata TaxID=56857 RepID=A0A200QXK7_MACCD|nr:hypothetical protein BVC80_3g14 [Macleaya cordata]